jgi:NADPH:quinone reductase-like Zn-dependent oxidoreductase
MFRFHSSVVLVASGAFQKLPAFQTNVVLLVRYRSRRLRIQTESKQICCHIIIVKKEMKAAYVHKIGDMTVHEDYMSVRDDLPIPEPKKGQVLVKVHTAAINPIDWKLAEGILPGYRGGVIGCDLSGVIERIGPGTVTDLQVGDEVYGDAMDTKGAFGEYCVVKAIVLAKKPSTISMKEAAALPLCGLTTVQGLINHGQFRAGQKVLIFGGTGGVGSLAIQMAKAMGASEVCATGSQVELMKKLGADLVVNYKEQNLMETLKGKDFDLVFDTIGSLEHWKIAKASMKPKGVFVTIMGDDTGHLMKDVATILWRSMKSMILGGQKYRFCFVATSAPVVVDTMKKLTELVEKGSVKPLIDKRTFELTTRGIIDLVKVSKTHRATGKLLLKVA